MKLLTLLFLATLTINAFASCEDGTEMAEAAVARLFKGQQCDFDVYPDKIPYKGNFERHTVTAYCNGERRVFLVTLEEYEDAVCGNVKVIETTKKASGKF